MPADIILAAVDQTLSTLANAFLMLVSGVVPVSKLRALPTEIFRQVLKILGMLLMSFRQSMGEVRY